MTEHAEDPRQYTYDFNALEGANTHDPLWHAAQREMLREGWMHNYMRMLWGKKNPGVVAIAAAGARDDDGPDESGRSTARSNSYAGCAWTLGKYDRPAPARPVYGTVRSMSSESGGRKLRFSRCLAANSASDRSDSTKRKRPVR